MKFKTIEVELSIKVEKGSNKASGGLIIKTGKRDLSDKDEYSEKDTTTGMEIGIVFDVSGSMRDSMNEVREALAYIVKNLGPRDVIHLVTFSTDAKIVFKDETRDNIDEMVQKINRIRCENTTNLMAGISLCANIMKSGSKKKSKQMIIFTDGLVNEGIKKNKDITKFIKVLKEYKIMVSTLGYTTDYDECLLSLIAECGGGNYAYIETSDKIKKILTETFELQSKVSFIDVVVKFETFGDTKITSILNHDDEFIQKNELYIGTLYDGIDIRNFILKVDLGKDFKMKKPLIKVKVEGVEVIYDPEGRKRDYAYYFNPDVVKIMTKKQFVVESKSYYSTVNWFITYYAPMLKFNSEGIKGVDILIKYLGDNLENLTPYKDCEGKDLYGMIKDAMAAFKRDGEDGLKSSAVKKLSTFCRQIYKGSMGGVFHH